MHTQPGGKLCEKTFIKDRIVERMRGNARTKSRWLQMPENPEEFVGQEHIVGMEALPDDKGRQDIIDNTVWPPAPKNITGQNHSFNDKIGFEKLNAVTAGVADIKRIVSDTQNPMLNPAGRTVLFIDEIHRFNKAQQDALLPYVENGTVVLIGATTENPYFEVNKSLISRSSVFMLKPLNKNDIETIVRICPM